MAEVPRALSVRRSTRRGVLQTTGATTTRTGTTDTTIRTTGSTTGTTNTTIIGTTNTTTIGSTTGSTTNTTTTGSTTNTTTPNTIVTIGSTTTITTTPTTALTQRHRTLCSTEPTSPSPRLLPLSVRPVRTARQSQRTSVLSSAHRSTGRAGVLQPRLHRSTESTIGTTESTNTTTVGTTVGATGTTNTTIVIGPTTITTPNTVSLVLPAHPQSRRSHRTPNWPPRSTTTTTTAASMTATTPDHSVSLTNSPFTTDTYLSDPFKTPSRRSSYAISSYCRPESASHPLVTAPTTVPKMVGGRSVSINSHDGHQSLQIGSSTTTDTTAALKRQRSYSAMDIPVSVNPVTVSTPHIRAVHANTELNAKQVEWSPSLDTPVQSFIASTDLMSDLRRPTAPKSFHSPSFQSPVPPIYSLDRTPLSTAYNPDARSRTTVCVPGPLSLPDKDSPSSYSVSISKTPCPNLSGHNESSVDLFMDHIHADPVQRLWSSSLAACDTSMATEIKPRTDPSERPIIGSALPTSSRFSSRLSRSTNRKRVPKTRPSNSDDWLSSSSSSNSHGPLTQRHTAPTPIVNRTLQSVSDDKHHHTQSVLGKVSAKVSLDWMFHDTPVMRSEKRNRTSFPLMDDIPICALPTSAGSELHVTADALKTDLHSSSSSSNRSSNNSGTKTTNNGTKTTNSGAKTTNSYSPSMDRSNSGIDFFFTEHLHSQCEGIDQTRSTPEPGQESYRTLLDQILAETHSTDHQMDPLQVDTHMPLPHALDDSTSSNRVLFVASDVIEGEGRSASPQTPNRELCLSPSTPLIHEASSPDIVSQFYPSRHVEHLSPLQQRDLGSVFSNSTTNDGKGLLASDRMNGDDCHPCIEFRESPRRSASLKDISETLESTQSSQNSQNSQIFSHITCSPDIVSIPTSTASYHSSVVGTSFNLDAVDVRDSDSIGPPTACVLNRSCINDPQTLCYAEHVSSVVQLSSASVADHGIAVSKPQDTRSPIVFRAPNDHTEPVVANKDLLVNNESMPQCKNDSSDDPSFKSSSPQSHEIVLEMNSACEEMSSVGRTLSTTLEITAISGNTSERHLGLGQIPQSFCLDSNTTSHSNYTTSPTTTLLGIDYELLGENQTLARTNDPASDKDVRYSELITDSAISNPSPSQDQISKKSEKEMDELNLADSQTTFTQFDDLISTQLLSSIQLDKLHTPTTPLLSKSPIQPMSDTVFTAEAAANVDTCDLDTDFMYRTDEQLLSTQMLATIPLDMYTENSDSNSTTDLTLRVDPVADPLITPDAIETTAHLASTFTNEATVYSSSHSEQHNLASKNVGPHGIVHGVDSVAPKASTADSYTSFGFDSMASVDQDVLDELHYATQLYKNEIRASEASSIPIMTMNGISSEDCKTIFAPSDGSLLFKNNEYQSSEKISGTQFGQDLGTGYKLASGKPVYVSSNSQHIGHALLYDDDEVVQRSTQLIRKKINASVTVPGTLRPLILLDAATNATKRLRRDLVTPNTNTLSPKLPVFTSAPRVAPKEDLLSFDQSVASIDKGFKSSFVVESPLNPTICETKINSGFTTGSGKALAPPSAAALKRASRLMDLEVYEKGSSALPSAPSSSEPSNEMMATPAKLDVTLSSSLTTPKYSGFKAASGKKLAAPSAEASRRSARLFADLDEKHGLITKDFAVQSATLSKKPATHSGKRVVSNSLCTHLDADENQYTPSRDKGARLHDALTLSDTFSQLESTTTPFKQEGSHWSTPCRPIARNKQVVSLSSLGKKHSTRLHLSPKLHSASSTPSLIRNSPFKMPTVRTPLSNRALHPQARNDSRDNRKSGIEPSFSKNATLTTKPPVVIYDLTAHTLPRPTLEQSFSDIRWPLVSDLLLVGIPNEVISLSLQNAEEYTFGVSGVLAARDALIESGASPKLASEQWVRNHYALILWKLSSLLRRFPLEYRPHWTFFNVVQQLKYRYETEINKARFSVIKQITEQDNVPTWHMVLCVTLIVADDLIELTDGWYRIRASLDDRLRFLTARGVIKIGQKLHLDGIQIKGPLPTTPLEMTSATHLKLHANGVQRAKWHTRLGYTLPYHIPRSIKSLVHNGGNIGCLDVIVVRQYPVVYKERLPNMEFIIRSEREENAAIEIWEQQGHLVYQGVQQECLGKYPDSSFDRYNEDEFGATVKRIFEERHPERVVSPILQVRVCDYPPKGVSRSDTRFATVSVQGDQYTHGPKLGEGMRAILYKVASVSRGNSDCIRLSLASFSPFINKAVDAERLAQTLYSPRQLIRADQFYGLSENDEIDTVSIVCAHLDRTHTPDNNVHNRPRHTILCCDASQHIFIVDIECNASLRLPDEFPVVWLRNLKYVCYDSQMQMSRLLATVYSEIKCTSSMSPFGSKPKTDLEIWRDSCLPTLHQVSDTHSVHLTRLV
ncbi:hypothetical protein BASA81_015246 [Batrachochytrium salamandrivorans]|nr:hypothetical protein BASA81_015246 [Batrachochytrium salamandrivorans]